MTHCLTMPSAATSPALPPRPIFWEHEGNKAVREGPWKLHLGAMTALFDLRADPAEQTDVTAEHGVYRHRLEQLATELRDATLPSAAPQSPQ